MQDNRKFRDVKDVDAVLKAARLERHEASRMTAEQKMDIIMLPVCVIAFLAVMFMLFVLPMML